MNCRSLLPVESKGYDVLILSDLLHFHTSHPALISSICALLPRTAKSRAFVGAGKYTSEAVCDDWVHAAHVAGLEMEEVQDDNTWTGRMEVVWSGTRLDERALTERKGNCRLWIGRWKGV
jgi:nicotinamide N-methyltransferase